MLAERFTIIPHPTKLEHIFTAEPLKIRQPSAELTRENELVHSELQQIVLRTLKNSWILRYKIIPKLTTPTEFRRNSSVMFSSRSCSTICSAFFSSSIFFLVEASRAAFL